MPDRNALILDTDGGVDDAQALLMLIANGRCPTAVTTVFGNVGLDAATQNILATLAYARVDLPVHRGAREPLAQPIIDAKQVHGEDGLGGAPRPDPIASPTGDDAVGFLCDNLLAAARVGKKIDLLMIGPLTNLALALRREPEITSGIGQVTIMGGTLCGRGKTTPAAEFNIYADPEAAAIVLETALSIVVVPWEPCTTHFLSGAAVDAALAAVPDSPYKTFCRALAEHTRGVSTRSGGPDVMRFIDPFAAAVAIEPEIVTKALPASVEVALAPGVTRGMTVIDPRGRFETPMVTLIEMAKIDRMTQLYSHSLTFVPAGP